MELVEQRQTRQQQAAAAGAAAGLAAQASLAAVVSTTSVGGDPSQQGAPPTGAPVGSGSVPGAPAAPAAQASGAVGGDVDGDHHDEDGHDLLEGFNVDNVEDLLYDDMGLHGHMRKAIQVTLFKHQVHKLKQQYNVEFAAMVKQKRADADKIMDLNVRIDETVRDLQKLGASVQVDERFVPPFPEDMSAVMKVQDSEVHVDKVLTGTDAARAEAAARAEEEARGKGKDGLADRALRQMMGGTLASQQEDDTEFLLVKPEWMDGNPKLFSEDQLKELREFQAREKSIQEEKAKRMTSLEAELRGLRAGVDETIGRFDDALQGLFNKRLKSQVEITALETRIISLSENVGICHTTSEGAEREMYGKLSMLRETRKGVSAELAEKRGLMAEAEARVTELQAEDKQLDRNFKKEFIDAESLYTKLLHLYRWRKAHEAEDEAHRAAGHGGARPHLSRQHSRHSDTMSITSHQTGPHHHDTKDKHHAPGSAHHAPSSIHHASSSAHHPPGPATPPTQHLARQAMLRELATTTMDPFPELPGGGGAAGGLDSEEPEVMEDSHKPDGLDLDTWSKFVEYRAQKIRAENELKRTYSRLAILKREVPRLETQDSELEKQDNEHMAAVTQLRNERKTALYDTELQLRLKAGQVEAEPPTAVSSDMSHALFLHRKVVEGVNEVVQSKGTRKVEILTAIKDFKKGIYQLEWEHKRCDMMIEDLKEKTRELQLLHVTRDIQTVFRDGEDKSSANEAASLEALLKQREKLHKKSVQEREKRMRKLKGLIDEKQHQNSEVVKHLVTLEKVLAEQERLRQSMQSIDEQTTRRMRSLVTHKKLKEIAAAQQAEMRALANELDAARLRTYPTFVEPARTLPPDTKSPFVWK